MFDEVEESGQDALGALLRQGLREIPTPAISPAFDERVLATSSPFLSSSNAPDTRRNNSSPA